MISKGRKTMIRITMMAGALVRRTMRSRACLQPRWERHNFTLQKQLSRSKSRRS